MNRSSSGWCPWVSNNRKTLFALWYCLRRQRFASFLARSEMVPGESASVSAMAKAWRIVEMDADWYWWRAHEPPA